MGFSLSGVQWNWYVLPQICSKQRTSHNRALVLRCTGLPNQRCGAIDDHLISNMHRLPEVQRARDILECAKEGVQHRLLHARPPSTLAAQVRLFRGCALVPNDVALGNVVAPQHQSHWPGRAAHDNSVAQQRFDLR